MSESPFFFEPPSSPGSGPVFGWLNPGKGSLKDLGVVLCGPLGREDLSAYRTLRHLAHRLADRGLATLRFDWPGTGNSAGDHVLGAQVALFGESIRCAVQELRSRCQIDQIALLGLRAGALLALEAAASGQDIAAIALVAPVLSGRAYLRELRALSAAAASREPAAEAPPSDDLESGGFLLSAETCADLAGLDHERPSLAPAPSMLFVNRNDMPERTRVLEQYASLVIALEHHRLPGYAELMLDPHRSEVPEEMVDAVDAWFGRLPNLLPRPAASAGGAGSSPLQARSAVAGSAIQEQAVSIPTASGQSQFAVLALPSSGAARHGLVLPNAGGVRTVGPSRLYVELARRLAASGWAVLRLDLPGLGDSEPQDGEDENDIYPRTAPADVACAMQWLRETTGVQSSHAAGLCSGAYHALKTALLDAGTNGIVIINPLTFQHPADAHADGAIPDSTVLRDLQRYRSKAFSLVPIKKLLRGKLHVRHAGQVFLRALSGQAAQAARRIARAMGVKLQEDLERDLRTLAERDVSLDFVFAKDEPGEALLRLQGGQAARSLIQDGRIRIHDIGQGDHTFSARGPRDMAIGRICSILEAQARSAAELRSLRQDERPASRLPVQP